MRCVGQSHCGLRLPGISEDELSSEARDNNCPERRGRESAGVDGKVSKCKFAKESHAGGGQPARTGVELSRETWSRLAWMDIYRRARTCRYFGISRQTFY